MILGISDVTREFEGLRALACVSMIVAEAYLGRAFVQAKGAR